MCSSEKKYVIIEFKDGLQVVPSCWINNNKITCWWPSHLTSKTDVTRAILRETMPREGDKWSKLTIVKIFGSSDNYVTALDKLAQAEETSNLEDSDLNSIDMAAARKKRQQRKKIWLYSSSDDDSDAKQLKINKEKSMSQEKTIKKPPQIDSLMKSNKQKITAIKVITSQQSSTSKLFHKPKNVVEIPQQGEKVSSGFEETVLRKLNSILTKLMILDNRMTQIESQRQIRRASNEDSDELEDEISLPIKSMAQLDEIEEKLKNRAFLEKMITYVKRFGGNDVNVVTTGILKKLFDDCFAEQFSWDGKRDKKEFKSLLIAKVLKRAVSSLCPNYTEMKIKKFGSQWLAQAKVRRIRRANKRTNEIDENNHDDIEN